MVSMEFCLVGSCRWANYEFTDVGRPCPIKYGYEVYGHVTVRQLVVFKRKINDLNYLRTYSSFFCYPTLWTFMVQERKGVFSRSLRIANMSGKGEWVRYSFRIQSHYFIVKK